MAQLRNHRHELFLREYFNCGWDGKKAYRKVYGPVKSAEVQASKLLAKPRIRARFNQMLKKIIKRADITEEKILSQYQAAYDMAEAAEKTADMISASTAQAKLVGLLRERTEIGAPGEFAHLDSISDVLEEIGRTAGPEIALKMQEAFGLKLDLEPEAERAVDSALADVAVATKAIN